MVKVTEIDRRLVVEEYEKGASILAIARLCDTHHGLIRRVLIAEGVTIRHPGPRRCAVDTAALVADDRARLPPAEIARRHGISRHTLRERLADAGELAGRRRPNVDAGEIRRRQALGQTLEEIARDVGLAAGTLRGRLASARRAAQVPQGQHTPLVARWQSRVPERPPEGVSARKWDAFRRVVAGDRQGFVAHDLGVSRVRVGQIARDVDEKLRRKEGSP